MPTIVTRVEPIYPEAARRNGIEGQVELMCLLGTDGKVMKVLPTAGHPELVKAAEGAVRRWRFTPPEVDGTPIAAWIRVELRFSLGSEIVRLMAESDTTRVFTEPIGITLDKVAVGEFAGPAMSAWVELRRPVDTKALGVLFDGASRDSLEAPTLAAPRFAMTFQIPEGRIVALIAPEQEQAQIRYGFWTWTASWTDAKTRLLLEIIASTSSNRRHRGGD